MGYGFTLVACFVEIKLKVCTNRELLSDRMGKKVLKIDNSFLPTNNLFTDLFMEEHVVVRINDHIRHSLVLYIIQQSG